jgi:hypothetical protein
MTHQCTDGFNGLREAVDDLILHLPADKTLRWAFDGDVEDPELHDTWEKSHGIGYDLGWIAGTADLLGMTRLEVCWHVGYTGDETAATLAQEGSDAVPK